MSNSQKMTLEEKLVQNLKEEKLFLLLDDEDALTELTKRAVQEALFQPRREKDGWRERDLDSPVVEAARTAARNLTTRVVEDLVNDPVIVKAVNDAIAAAMPVAIRNYADGLMGDITAKGANAAYQMVEQAIRNRTIGQAA